MNIVKPITSEKLSMLKNRKLLLGGTALLMGLVVICLYSFIPYTISPEKLHEPDFFTDLLINCAIVVLAMTSTVFIGQASNAQNPKSKIAKATVSFIESKAKVVATGIHKFKQWIKKVQQPNDIVIIKHRILDKAGIEDYSIVDLNKPEILALIDVPQKYNGKFYKAITKEQAKTIIHLKEKGIKLNLVQPEYYLSVKNLIDNRTRSERAANEGKKKTVTLLLSLGSKLILTVTFAIVFAVFVKDLSEDQSIAEAFAKLFARLWCFFTSVFMGYLVGCQTNDIDAEYIDMRVETHLEFLEDKTFVATSLEDEAREEYIERVKKEQVIPGLTEKEHDTHTLNLPTITSEQ